MSNSFQPEQSLPFEGKVSVGLLEYCQSLYHYLLIVAANCGLILIAWMAIKYPEVLVIGSSLAFMTALSFLREERHSHKREIEMNELSRARDEQQLRATKEIIEFKGSSDAYWRWYADLGKASYYESIIVSAIEKLSDIIGLERGYSPNSKTLVALLKLRMEMVRSLHDLRRDRGWARPALGATPHREEIKDIQKPPKPKQD